MNRNGWPVAMLGLALAGCAAFGPAEVAHRPPAEGVRVNLHALDQTGGGTPVQFEGETLTLREPPIVSSEDIDDVRLWIGNDGWPAIVIGYRPEARERLHAASSEVLGQRLAFSVNGRVISLVRVQDAFGEASAINGLSSMEQAQDILREITGQSR